MDRIGISFLLLLLMYVIWYFVFRTFIRPLLMIIFIIALSLIIGIPDFSNYNDATLYGLLIGLGVGSLVFFTTFNFLMKILFWFSFALILAFVSMYSHLLKDL